MGLAGNKYPLLILSAVLLIFLYQKYEKTTELKNNYTVLLNEKSESGKKLEETNEENIQKKIISDEQMDKMNNIILTLDFNTLKNETEFKKIIYLFSEESGLNLREIGKAEYV